MKCPFCFGENITCDTPDTCEVHTCDDCNEKHLAYPTTH